MTDISPEAMLALAEQAFARLPEPIRRLANDIVIQIVDRAEDDVLADLGIDHPDGLLGLYHGLDVLQKSGFDTVPQQDLIFLYRLPILRFWREGTEDANSLDTIVSHVLIHEIGHHFGLSDEDMHAIEDAG